MIDTYQAARDAVAAELGPLWGETPGTFYVADEGFEDADSYMVPWGAREWLVDDDPAFVLLNGAVTFVDKASGFVSLDTMVTNLARVDRMTPTR